MAQVLLVALSLVATSQASMTTNSMPESTAPAGSATTRYCLRVDPLPGSRLETIQCRTREDWALLEVDVDQEWAQNGVRVIA
jgi:hypothetical protein